MCLFASGPSTFCSSLPPGISVPRVPLGVFSIGTGLGRLRLGLRLDRLLERELEHLFYTARQVEGHGIAYALGHVVEIFFVAPRQDDLLESHAVGGQHLLLDTA